MSTRLSRALGMLVAVAFGAGLAACERPDPGAAPEGPAERTGEQLDQALSRAGDQLNKVAEQTGKNLEAFGRRLQAEAREAQQARSSGDGGEQGSGGSGGDTGREGEDALEQPADEQRGRDQRSDGDTPPNQATR